MLVILGNQLIKYPFLFFSRWWFYIWSRFLSWFIIRINLYLSTYIDIIAGKIPEDIEDFNGCSGIYFRYNQTLESWNDLFEEHEDRIPSVFMARTKPSCSILWDDYFKVDEHEDFFYECQ
jgi:hypothetical protein